MVRISPLCLGVDIFHSLRNDRSASFCANGRMSFGILLGEPFRRPEPGTFGEPFAGPGLAGKSAAMLAGWLLFSYIA